MRAVLALLMAAPLLSGCAELLNECAGVMLQATAQVCVDVLCDPKNTTDDDDNTDDTDEGRAKTLREAPPPDWQPHEGACDVTSDDAGAVHVGCPDGTRALFRPVRPDSEHALTLHGAHEADDVCGDGVVVLQGIDADNDGVLSATEMTGRTVDCPEKDGVRAPTLVGFLAIHGPDDVARLSGRRALTGGLLIKSPALVRLELPELQSIGATLRVDAASSLETLALPHLASVGADVVIARAPQLTFVDLPVLARVGGSVVVVDNPRLPQADIEALIFRLTRSGFAGPVDLAGNAARAPAGAPPPG